VLRWNRVYNGHTRKRAVPMITTPMKPKATATRGRSGIDAETSNSSPARKLLIPASRHPTFFVFMAIIWGVAFEQYRNPA